MRLEPGEDGSSGSQWDNSCDEDEESESDYLSQPSESKLSKRSTKKKSHAVPKSMRDKFIRSLQTFRNRDPPSDEEKRALDLFYHIERGIPKKRFDSDYQRHRDSNDLRTDSSSSLESERFCSDYLNYSPD